MLELLLIVTLGAEVISLNDHTPVTLQEPTIEEFERAIQVADRVSLEPIEHIIDSLPILLPTALVYYNTETDGTLGLLIATSAGGVPY